MDVAENYIQGNKAAWEEAFEQRSPEWGADVLARLRDERYPFLRPELIAEVERIDWRGKTAGQFCCNNGRELLSIVRQGAQEGIGFDLAENQVEFANRVARALDAPCTFIASDILPFTIPLSVQQRDSRRCL
jgi:hypothetical protein